MLDEEKLKDLLHVMAIDLIDSLFLPGVHNLDNVKNASDSIYQAIELANLTVDTGE